jgi:hypothetical protein
VVPVLGRRLLPLCVLLFALQAHAQGPRRASQKPVTRNPHGALNIPCENCHTSLSWKPIRSIPEFDHDKTSYPLRGMHEKVQCAQCHVKLVFTNVGQKCSDCHADIHRGQFGANCESCHTVKGWKVSVTAVRDHQNRFPLIGAHAAVDCESCHTGAATGQFQGLSTQCYSCHATDYKGTTNPNHVTAGFPTACEQCHNTNNWLNATFDHSKTGFPLTNAHADPPRVCLDCHINNNYNLTSTACVTCHLTNYRGAKNPDHVAGGFAQTCQQCHSTSAWQPATFDHTTVGFPLTNAHADPPRVCLDCHINNNYNLTTTACVSCHLANYQGAKNPDHVAGHFAQTCQTCHSTSAWQPATFDHTTVGFPLTNAHADPPRVCLDCHINNNYNLTTTACVSCHLANYQGAKNPDHVAGNFSQTCQQCHNTSAWQPATFDHNSVGFPLTNAHADPPRVCLDCHINNNYNLTTTTCASCHLKDYNAATTPLNHVQLGFPTTCQSCHDTVAWTNGRFDHSTTGFLLTNAHADPPRVCLNCHINNNYNLTSTACVTCHLSNFQGATNPNHVAGGFSQTCQTCHNTSAWQPATFDHTTVGFPLTNAHADPPRVCLDCHTNNNYNLTSTACVTCHLSNFQGATNPNHVAGGFSQTCQTCHTTSAWQPATFDHTTVGFPLTNAHADPPRVCLDCHINNNYNLTTTACASCHLKDYNTATAPVNHAQAGFPTTCESCHDTVLWTHGKFDHSTTGFTLTNSHTVPPRICADCHINNNYNLTSANTTCVSCHLNAYNTATTPINHIQVGFPTTCQLCHDTTLWTNGKFDHNTTAFPLTGFHTKVACASCHVNNNYTTLPTTCYGCHATDYNNTSNPIHKAAPTIFTTTCATCHNTTAWTGATFNHSWWNVNHGNANGVCATCHTNPNDYTVFQCTGCHGGGNPNNFHHPNVGGYVYNSVNCYQCHKNGGG